LPLNLRYFEAPLSTLRVFEIGAVACGLGAPGGLASLSERGKKVSTKAPKNRTKECNHKPSSNHEKEIQKKKQFLLFISETGNRTPSSCVRGRNVNHYTICCLLVIVHLKFVLVEHTSDFRIVLDFAYFKLLRCLQKWGLRDPST
jgi:hypothetical protein